MIVHFLRMSQLLCGPWCVASGGFDTVGRALQIGASWSKEIEGHEATLTFASASNYGRSGITGLGFQANGALIGGGASVSWSNPSGRVS